MIKMFKKEHDMKLDKSAEALYGKHFDTSVAVYSEIRKTYNGPLDLAQDFMVWNVTKDDIQTRMAVPNHESFPTPPQKQKQPPDSMKILGAMFSETTTKSVEPESAAVTNAQIEAFNKRNGTDVKPGLTGIPFMKKQ